MVARRQARLPGRFCCFLDNQTRAATDEQASYQLWEGKGLFWALQRVCVGVWGWDWELVRVVANLSTPCLLVWPEYKELGEQWARGCFWRGNRDHGTVWGGRI